MCLHQHNKPCFMETFVFILCSFSIGKTFVHNTFLTILRGRKKNVAAAAWDWHFGSTFFSGGRTLHNLFKLPVPILDTSTCNVSPTSDHAATLRDLHLIIMDEASIIPVHALCAIDLLLFAL